VADRFPDYDVLAKRDTPSWNRPTRDTIDARLALSDRIDVLSAAQRATLRTVAARIVPPPEGRPAVNTVAILLDKIGRDTGDGFRPAGLPRLREAWERGLDGLECEAQARHGEGLDALDGDTADQLLSGVEQGELAANWRGLNPQIFWRWRLIPDLVSAYYAHPSAWSAMGFGGPASPRGYVRLDANRRDPWEAAERADGAVPPARLRKRHAG
jgi:hypothetical protein